MAEVRAAGDPAFVAGGDLAVARAYVEAVAGPGDELARFRSFLDAHADALYRTCAPGHLTGSAFVVDGAGERGLLLFHTKLQRWLQPGGHADGEADLSAVALREATEETGIAGLRVAAPPIDLDIHEVRPPNEAPHLHYDVRFLVLAPPGAIEAPNHESTGARWLPEHALTGAEHDEELALDPGTRRLAHRAFALARTLLHPFPSTFLSRATSQAAPDEAAGGAVGGLPPAARSERSE